VSTVLVEVNTLRQSHVADTDRLLAELDASEAREQALGQEIETQTALVEIATARAARLRGLVEQALRPDSDLADAEEQLVKATLALLERQSERNGADKQAAISRRALAAQEADFAVTLASIRRKDTERLIEMGHKLAELDDLIAHAEIRAPVAGTVAALPFDAAGDVARAGEVLAQISAPVEGVEIKLRVPIRYIDQVTRGERGTILIPSLPQRQMPHVGMTVIAVGSSAELDRDGNPTNYAALALIDPEDVAPLLHALGPGYRIVRDMPVVVMLEGRATTPLGYFLDPLRAAAQLAFEEG
jgi:protease secretion system membrane fusion protein